MKLIHKLHDYLLITMRKMSIYSFLYLFIYFLEFDQFWDFFMDLRIESIFIHFILVYKSI